MGDLFPIGLAYGPLLTLGALQLFAVRRLASRDTVKTFLWGLVFALAAVPLLALVGGVEGPTTPDGFVMAGMRMARIWLILWGIAVAARIGGIAFNYAWARRPRRAA